VQYRNTVRSRKYSSLIIGFCLLALAGAASPAASTARPAAIYLSDSTVLTGKVRLSPGRKFKLNIPRGGTLKTKDMITGQDVQYGKVRLFDFGPLREIRFYPEREEMQRAWRFLEQTRYDEKTATADYTPARKEYFGEPYPVRYIAATAVFNSGESIQGHLYTATVYLKTDNGTRRFVLRSKQRGKTGTTLDELVYVTRIKLLDEGRKIAPSITVKFAGMTFGPDDAVTAVTRDSLTPLPGRRTGEDTFVIDSAFGEDFYLAARKDDSYIVGWPETTDTTLFELTADHLKRQRDFYNDKELLGIIENTSAREVLALVNLRRRHSPTHFGSIGGEWDHKVGGIVEPWRLSIWRWKYDKPNRELILTGRGTFFRVILRPDDPTPKAVISPKLWHMSRRGETVIVGKTGENANPEK